ncbi:MAG TPA: response regulator [Planctomycetota bacterium]|nr:response regulator [Planctomycetota bacterium]
MGALPADRILVIEDNADIRAALKAMLESAYQVEVAEDGREGLEMVRRLKPSLVISDLIMPGLSGIEICKAVRADPALAHIPVVILTAHGELKLKLDGFSSGADDYLQKPFNARELLARIRALLENRALQRELARKNEELERALADLRAAQEKLLEGERLATALKMAGALAHEINNPLSGILGYCEFLKMTLGPQHPARAELDKILEQAKRVAEVVRRIQDLREVKFVKYVGAETIVDLSTPKPGAVRTVDSPARPT